jgi:hypothetical protein
LLQVKHPKRVQRPLCAYQTQPSSHIAADARLDALAASLAAEIAAAEVQLVGAVLARPNDLVAAAEREGIAPAVFGQEDVRILYAAADVARDRPVANVLHLAKIALQRAGYWNSQGAIGTGCQWSDESLVALAKSHLASTLAVRCYARELLALTRRWETAQVLLGELLTVLSDSHPAARSPPAPPAHKVPPRRTAPPFISVRWIGRPCRHGRKR